MQLVQIIRRTSTRVWALALIPALALAALTFLVTSSPPAHQLTATLGVGAPSGTQTAATVTQAVDSFRSALATSAVRQAAADEVGLDELPESDVASTRLGASNLVEVTVTARDRDDLEPLVLALVRSANELLYTSARNDAQAQRESAQRELDAVMEKVDAVSKDGAALPAQRYQTKAAEVTQLRVALAGARARGGVEATGLQSSLDRATRELETLGEKVRELDEQSVPLLRARTRLADAAATVSAIDAGLTAANDEDSIKLGPVAEESQSTVLLRALVAGLVVGVAVAVGFVLLLGALRSSDSEDRARPGE